MKSEPSFTKSLLNLTGSLERMNGQSVLRSLESTSKYSHLSGTWRFDLYADARSVLQRIIYRFHGGNPYPRG